MQQQVNRYLPTVAEGGAGPAPTNFNFGGMFEPPVPALWG